MNIKQVHGAGLSVYGDPDWRGKCPLEAAEAVSFFSLSSKDMTTATGPSELLRNLKSLAG